ncbi:MAG: cobalt transporter CbiM [Veillonellales bacterium]
MHIPDGYLSPSTCLTLGAVMLPVWYRASAVVKKSLDVARIPFMAMGAVFAFLIMMFNVPIPDGTTAHAVGSVLIAIVLGPWAAVVAVSVALFIQALVFGDGGMLAFGVNAFNMAVIMPFTGYYMYRLVAGRATGGSLRAVVAAGIGGYVGLNLAALAAAIEFGIQPLLFTAADGTPLYCPYGLSVAIPAMMTAHLLVAGFVEAAVTALVVKYVWKTAPEVVAPNGNEK